MFIATYETLSLRVSCLKYRAVAATYWLFRGKTHVGLQEIDWSVCLSRRVQGASARKAQEVTPPFISMTSLSWLVGDDVPHQPAHLARVPAGSRNALKFLCTAASQKMSEDCDAEAWLLAGGNSLSLSFFFFLVAPRVRHSRSGICRARKECLCLGRGRRESRTCLTASSFTTVSARRVLPLKTFCSSGP